MHALFYESSLIYISDFFKNVLYVCGQLFTSSSKYNKEEKKRAHNHGNSIPSVQRLC